MEAQAARHTILSSSSLAIAITLFSLVGIGAFLRWIRLRSGPRRSQHSRRPGARAARRAARQPKPAVKPRRREIGAPRASRRSSSPAHGAESARVRGDREVARSRNGQASGPEPSRRVVGGVVGHQMGRRARRCNRPWRLGAPRRTPIEKNARTTVEYQIIVRYEDGTKACSPGHAADWRAATR